MIAFFSKTVLILARIIMELPYLIERFFFRDVEFFSTLFLLKNNHHKREIV